MKELTDKQKLELLDIWRRKPEIFFRDALGAECEDYQIRLLRTIAENSHTAARACHSVGKSFSLGRVVLWFATCYPYSLVITTAPTYLQVRSILWAEIRAAHSRAKVPLGGKMNQTEWSLTPEGDWKAFGFTPRNELSGDNSQGTASSFQGFHASDVLVIFDEAVGIPPSVWIQVEGLLASGRVKFVAVGNPTSPACDFARCFKDPTFAKVKIDCFDSPNFKANGITNLDELKREISYVANLTDEEARKRVDSYKLVKPHLINLKWVVQMGQPRKWGVEHPLFVSKILADFPQTGDNVFIPLSAVESAQLRCSAVKIGGRKTIGVDVARYGTDLTVLTALHGNAFKAKKIIRKASNTEVAGEVIAFDREVFGAEGGAEVITVDGTGVGSGVVDCLLESKGKPGSQLNHRVDIREVQFGAACLDEHDQTKYGNVKARMFDLLAQDLKDEDGLTLPTEDVYLDELPTIKYRFDSKGRKFVESKDEYKSRTGRPSPDHADSLALANYGKYDEVGVGKFTEAFAGGGSKNREGGFSKPFAAGLGAGKQW